MDFEYTKIEVPQPPPPPVVEDRFILSFTREEFRALMAVSGLIAGSSEKSMRKLFDNIWMHGVHYGFRDAINDTRAEGQITFPNRK